MLSILPEEIERVEKLSSQKRLEDRALPSNYTIVQLLKSFSGFHKWMSDAAKGGTVNKLTSQLEEISRDVSRNEAAAYAETIAKRSSLLYQRGRRYAFEKKFDKAVADFDLCYRLVEDLEGEEDEKEHQTIKNLVRETMGKEEYCRLYEWVGMCRHLRYDLKGALECYEKCSELEPDNVSEIQWSHSILSLYRSYSCICRLNLSSKELESKWMGRIIMMPKNCLPKH